MKLAVTGKGGVGKTTICALLAGELARRGRHVFAIDADPDSNLAACMGHPNPAELRPLVELKDLIEERTGVKAGTTGGMFRLNPFVADIPAKYAVELEGVKVLVAGAVKKGGSGCYCPENALVRALISHLLLDEETTLVLDMEAGVEHLSRGTVAAMDRLLVIVEPGRRSVETALRIKGMAADLGLERLNAIGNRIRTGDDEAFLRETLEGVEFAGFVPYETTILESERLGRSVRTGAGSAGEAVAGIVEFLEE